MYLNVEAMPQANAMPSANSRAVNSHERQRRCETGREPVDGVHDHLGLWIRQQEQADPRDPQHPPGHGVRAEAIRQPAAECAERAGGKREAGRQQRRLRRSTSPYSALKYCGIQIDNAVKPPNTIE